MLILPANLPLNPTLNLVGRSASIDSWIPESWRPVVGIQNGGMAGVKECCSELRKREWNSLRTGY